MRVALILVGLVCLISTTTITAQNVQEVELPKEALDCINQSVPVARKYLLCKVQEGPEEEECKKSFEQNPEFQRIDAECERARESLNDGQKDYMEYLMDSQLN